MILIALFLAWPLIFFFLILQASMTGCFLALTKIDPIKILSCCQAKDAKHALEDCFR
jgi:DMSO reductase anchor subunit